MMSNYRSKLHIDIETYSPVDIKSGLYAYAEQSEILMLAYSYDDTPINIIELTNSQLPTRLIAHLQDPTILKVAYNAQFERVCLSYLLKTWLSPRGWYCSMAGASYQGAVGGLAQTSKLLNGYTEKQTIGKQLINYFCKPCKPTKANGQRTRNLPEHNPVNYKMFMDYCINDVKAEKQIPFYDNFEFDLYVLDQEINDRGFKCNWNLVENAIDIDTKNQAKNKAELKELTGLDNPNSQVQLTTWLTQQLGKPVNSIDKKSVENLLQSTTGNVKRVLELRQLTSSSSVSKFKALLANRVNGRVSPSLAFMMTGTGRWAGRLFQIHNLPRQETSDQIMGLVEMGEIVQSQELKGLVRKSIIGDLLVADFSAIEARVLAWLAGERWRLDVFKGDGKIYEASAAMMFNVPVETIVQGHENYALRAKGKIAELALGYQGSVGAMAQFGALDMGLTEESCLELVRTWRKANKNIVQLWYTMEDAVKHTILTQKVVKVGYILLKFDGKTLWIKLPSGRKLAYYNARLEDKVKFGKTKTCIVYDKAKVSDVDTYGGKLIENITQAVARDCLARAMLNLDKVGYKIILHIHDEIVCERKKGQTLEQMIEIMSRPISWAEGLELGADGFEDTKYHK